jgi:hypothetical protein
MNWVKENYDRFLLAVAAVVLAVSAFLLFNQSRSFGAIFDSLKDPVIKSKDVPAANPEVIAKQSEHLTHPDTWKPRIVAGRPLPVFVSVPYIAKSTVDPTTQEVKETLVDPLAENSDNLHPPIPNKWFLDNNQDLLAQNALTQDTDGDGFTTIDEFNGQTDPQDKEKHPPYITKLFIKDFRRIPFRLLFAARNGETVLLNTLDLDAPTQFLKVGMPVAGTKFKLTKLDVKSVKENNLSKDVSVITLTNTETGETIELPKEKEVDSPTTYAVMSYLWAGKDFAVKKGTEFTLKPEDNIKYRCIELSATEVTLLRLDNNQQLKIKPLPKS